MKVIPRPISAVKLAAKRDKTCNYVLDFIGSKRHKVSQLILYPGACYHRQDKKILSFSAPLLTLLPYAQFTWSIRGTWEKDFFFFFVCVHTLTGNFAAHVVESVWDVIAKKRVMKNQGCSIGCDGACQDEETNGIGCVYGTVNGWSLPSQVYQIYCKSHNAFKAWNYMPRSKL